MATKGTRTQKEQNTESLQDVDSRTRRTSSALSAYIRSTRRHGDQLRIAKTRNHEIRFVTFVLFVVNSPLSPSRTRLRSKSEWENAHPGARASRPHRTWRHSSEPCKGRFGALFEGMPLDRRLLARIRLRAGRPRSRGASSHDVGISRSRYRRYIRARLVIEGGPSLFVSIRGSSFLTIGCFSSNDPQSSAGAKPA